MKIATLNTVLDRVQKVYSQVERYAAEKNPKHAEMMTQPLKRSFGQLKLELMGAGLDSLSQLAGSMEIAAGRGGAQQTKVRILREGVGSMRFQVEQEQRKVVSEDQAREREADAKAAREKQDE